MCCRTARSSALRSGHAAARPAPPDPSIHQVSSLTIGPVDEKVFPITYELTTSCSESEPNGNEPSNLHQGSRSRGGCDVRRWKEFCRRRGSSRFSSRRERQPCPFHDGTVSRQPHARSHAGVSRKLHQPKKHLLNPVVRSDRWCDGNYLQPYTTMYDEEEKLFKMWARAGSDWKAGYVEGNAAYMLYFTSTTASTGTSLIWGSWKWQADATITSFSRAIWS